MGCCTGATMGLGGGGGGGNKLLLPCNNLGYRVKCTSFLLPKK